jgi:PAC2 family
VVHYPAPVLLVDHLPSLKRPVIVVALTGWVDAGSAGADCAEYLESHLVDPVTFARIDLADLVDLQHTRPQVGLDTGEARVISWPEITLIAGRLPSTARVAGGSDGQDVVVIRGPEPGLRWRGFCQELVELARSLDARLAVMVAGMPVVVSHRRPIRVLATATARSLAQEVEPLRGDYEGPTGVQTVLQHAFGVGGVPAVGLWAQVPHYLAGGPSPAATAALIRRVAEVASLAIDPVDLGDAIGEYHAKVEETLGERPDMAELVEQLDNSSDGLPTGDELASEIERFLRGDDD